MEDIREELEKVSFFEEISSKYNPETVRAIKEAIENPSSLHKLNSWEELGI